MPTTELTDEDFAEEGTIDLITMLIKAGLVPTRSEGRRAIEQGGVSIDGEKITDIKHTVSKDTLTGKIRWSCPQENRGKRNLTDKRLCYQIISIYILSFRRKESNEEIRE